ncbi:hypothetical protein HID58_059729 [Brassica napus]|uniref:Uncharacterized protein n=1 Tax=Brassica napus TaxID=3708 RepID=A0ABQ7ZU10_BRANA|nr:hypothetical protein HID58_059729 [Brassica napus]
MSAIQIRPPLSQGRGEPRLRVKQIKLGSLSLSNPLSRKANRNRLGGSAIVVSLGGSASTISMVVLLDGDGTLATLALLKSKGKRYFVFVICWLSVLLVMEPSLGGDEAFVLSRRFGVSVATELTSTATELSSTAT